MKKILSLILVICLAGTLMVGCTPDETSLWNAYVKTSNAKSSAAVMSMKLSLKSEGASNPSTDMVIGILDNMVFDITEKTINDTEKGITKTSMTLSTTVMGMKLNVNMWVDLDMSDPKQPKGMIIYELPKILMGQSAKQYFYIDMSKLSELTAESGMNLDTSTLFDTTKSLDMFAKLDTTGMKVEKKDDAYQVSISNAAVFSLLKQYYGLLASLPQLNSIFTEDMKTELFDGIDKVSALNIFGDKGITSNITVNKDGYMENFDIAAEMLFDSAQLEEAFGGSVTDPAEKYRFGFDIKTKYSDYNAVSAIDAVPALTDENSESYFDYISSLLPAYPNDQSDTEVAVVVNSKPVQFDTQPWIVDGRTMVSEDEILNALGATSEYDEATNTVTSHLGDKTLTHVIGENTILVNGEPIQMDVASFEEDGQIFVPVRFFSEALGAKVEWLEESHAVLITLE